MCGWLKTTRSSVTRTFPDCPSGIGQGKTTAGCSTCIGLSDVCIFEQNKPLQYIKFSFVCCRLFKLFFPLLFFKEKKLSFVVYLTTSRGPLLSFVFEWGSRATGPWCKKRQNPFRDVILILMVSPKWYANEFSQHVTAGIFRLSTKDWDLETELTQLSYFCSHSRAPCCSLFFLPISLCLPSLWGHGNYPPRN